MVEHLPEKATKRMKNYIVQRDSHRIAPDLSESVTSKEDCKGFGKVSLENIVELMQQDGAFSFEQ